MAGEWRVAPSQKIHRLGLQLGENVAVLSLAEDTAVCNDDWCRRRTLQTSDGGVLEIMEHVEPIDHLCEGNVLEIVPCCGDKGDEELALVCVATAVCHRDDAATTVRQDKVFISENPPICPRAFAAGAVAVFKIAALGIVSTNNAVEAAAFIPVPLRVGGEPKEVDRRLWHDIVFQFNHQPPDRRCPDLQIHEYSWVLRVRSTQRRLRKALHLCRATPHELVRDASLLSLTHALTSCVTAVK